tara:strand:+ start:7437 stop:7583 length:147 start_codon:yes stop_codon:yes gene_type:complete
VNDRIEAMDIRLRAVERSVVEIATGVKWVRLVVVIMLASLGVDVQGMI